MIHVDVSAALALSIIGVQKFTRRVKTVQTVLTGFVRPGSVCDRVAEIVYDFPLLLAVNDAFTGQLHFGVLHRQMSSAIAKRYFVFNAQQPFLKTSVGQVTQGRCGCRASVGSFGVDQIVTKSAESITRNGVQPGVYKISGREKFHLAFAYQHLLAPQF